MASPTAADLKHLGALARLYGVEPGYLGMDKRWHTAPAESVLLTLRALGAPVEGPGDIMEALRVRRMARGRRALAPVTVAWNGSPDPVRLRLPVEAVRGTIRCRLEGEAGYAISREYAAASLAAGRRNVDGSPLAVLRLPLPENVPFGYHTLTVEADDQIYQGRLISAPEAPASSRSLGRDWGVFLPLYALRGREDWGAGDFTLLTRLGRWLAGLGGSVLGTLPLLASFLDRPFDPSPYAPVSRLAWNEFYLDVRRLPGLETLPEGRAAIEDGAFLAEIDVLRREPLVDYRRIMAAKRRVLAPLAARFFHDSGPYREEFEAFMRSHGYMEDYARFRAATELQGRTWPQWPAVMRDGALTEGDYDPAVARYHTYVQWLADRALAEAASSMAQDGVRIYLDLPLGVHSEGYDVWRYRGCFALEAAGGAPPDPFFTGGQNWGFPPLHPEGIREDGYGYVIAGLQHHLARCRVLRIDHVMGLHRLFWVPHGVDARDGVYVRYPADELWAVLCVEAHRHGAVLVGENLGTVPPSVDRALEHHGALGMYMLQFMLGPARDVEAPGATELAALNTHDMPTFAGFWQGLDLEDRRDLGLLDDAGMQAESQQRAQTREAARAFLGAEGLLDGRGDEQEVLRAALRYLGGSASPLVMVSLEDLWGETAPQNTPGTSSERPNWLRRARYSLEDLPQRPEVEPVLRELDSIRRTSGEADA